MSETQMERERRLSFATRRFQHWDRISRERALGPLESLELERALKQIRGSEIRAQASAPAPGRRGRG